MAIEVLDSWPVRTGARAAAMAIVNAKLPVAAYNGATYDNWHNNLEGTALTSAARIATTNSADIVNYNHRGIILFLNVTVASGTGGLQVQIQTKDPVSGNYVSTNTAPTAITATGFTAYFVFPGINAGGSQASSGFIGRTIRVRVTHGDASSYTYSVGYVLVV